MRLLLFLLISLVAVFVVSCEEPEEEIKESKANSTPTPTANPDTPDDAQNNDVQLSTVSSLSSVTAISAGHSHTCALIKDGTVKCWGWNEVGQLGDGTIEDSSIPVTVHDLNSVAAISAGAYHNCALIKDGTVKCWGYNSSRQLGSRSEERRYSSTPLIVPTVSLVSAVSAANSHTCALIKDGTVKCWGWNGSLGILGNGVTTEGVSYPVTVSTLSSATSVSSRYTHNCALISDGSVKCWGSNLYGKLGDGTFNDSSTPKSIPSAFLSSATAISNGIHHTCALISDGSAKCWGLNGSGKLGDGTIEDSSTPVEVLSLTSAKAISAGDDHTCALISDSTVKCWGLNYYGQLGGGTSANYSHSPLKIPSLSSVTAISAYWNHTCALISDGTVKCWGDNEYGQLGNGTTASN